MVEQIAANLYKVEIPLPKMGLDSINSYVIKAGDKNLIIDAGMNNELCRKTMEASLKEIGVELDKTDFFVTHFHIDHFGLVPALVSNNSTIYFNRKESNAVAKLRTGDFLPELINSGRIAGFPEDELSQALECHPVHEHKGGKTLPFTYLEDGDILEIGEYRFICVTTPGHSRGHTCLYEPREKILIAGDHLLNDITPIVPARFDENNPLKEYLSSLDKIYDLDIDLVLPGHKGIFRNHRQRIEELRDHHRNRGEEIIPILGKGSGTAYTIASQMTWNTGCDSWDAFPVAQKFFAVGETTSHLKYLEGEGIIRIEMREQKAVCSLM